jgi:D-glycero-D-manno-heptose 1,7-bisphosphate phosphatase
MIQNSNTELRKCCFLDRDGVANVEVDYLHEVEKTVLEEGFADTVKAAHANGYLAIIITNQAGIARGKFPLEDLYKVHDRIQELLAEQGEKIDAIYFCPHHPEYSGECNCRKQAPGMILKAAEEWNIDLSESLMIGDRITDCQCGKNAGCKASYLVRTGYGLKTLAENPDPGFPVADNSYAAFTDFLKKQG